MKWKEGLSEHFITEQCVRQGGAVSADLYKVYINPLLNLICESVLGDKIGNINYSAPTCADDVAIISSDPRELQMMVDMAVDFSRREGYSLQPTKSVILPVKTGAYHCSYSPLFRQPIISTTHYSNSPLLRRPIFPTI